jgi:hypothetical protein
MSWKSTFTVGIWVSAISFGFKAALYYITLLSSLHNWYSFNQCFINQSHHNQTQSHRLTRLPVRIHLDSK